tara:strand:- start:8341 stop:8640 length:300 start_codon:yes stop_codon:yes gene_type:complete
MARLRNFGGRKVSKQTKRAAKKLIRGNSKRKGAYSENMKITLKGMTKRERRSQAVDSIYAAKRQSKYMDGYNQDMGNRVLASVGIDKKTFKKGGIIQHD